MLGRRRVVTTDVFIPQLDGELWGGKALVVRPQVREWAADMPREFAPDDTHAYALSREYVGGFVKFIRVFARRLCERGPHVREGDLTVELSLTPRRSESGSLTVIHCLLPGGKRHVFTRAAHDFIRGDARSIPLDGSLAGKLIK